MTHQRRSRLRLARAITPVLVSILGLVAARSLAQDTAPLPAVKAASPIPLDCDPTNPTWSKATPLTGFLDISHGSAVADQAIARILYDETNIYIIVECKDAHPEGIVGRETVRDSLFNQNSNSNFPSNEDYVLVTLDPFNTHISREISIFGVNALGTRSAQIAGGRAAKAEWSGDWQAMAKRTPTGWIAQLQIPWKLIHYPSGRKTVDIGLDFARFQYRTQTMSLWRDIGVQTFWDREGRWTGVDLPKDGFHHTFSALPYALGGLVNGETNSKFGVDARYLITPQLTAVGTVNPDFSTIEGAIQTIQFSHYARAVQEFRPFFTEGGSNFNPQTNYNDIGAFLYTPQIQSFNYGGKVYGKIANNDTIGALAIGNVDGREDQAIRYLHSYSPTSTGGAMVTSTNAAGGQNTVGETDQHFRWGKFGVEGIASTSTGPGAGGGAEIISAFYADKRLTSDFQASEISSNFIAPDGFFPYTGYKGLVAVEDYTDTWHHGPWRTFDISGAYLSWMTMNGGRYYDGFQGSASIETRSDIHLEFDYVSDFQLGSNDNTLGVNLVYGATNRFRQFGIQAQTGELGGVHTTFIAPTASVRLINNLDLLYAAAFQNREGLTQQHIITVNYQMSPTRSLGGRVVVNGADTNAYFFYHNSGGKGTEFFLLFGDPNAPRTVKAIQAKVVFVLQR